MTWTALRFAPPVGLLAAALALLVGLLVPDGAMAFPLAVNDGSLAPQVLAGLDEALELGPSGIAVTADRVFLADPLAHRVLELGFDGRVLRAWPFTLAPHDLLRDGRGGLCAFDAAVEQVECVTSTTKGGGARTGKLPNRSVTLALGPAGAPWVVRDDGHAVAALNPARTVEKAIPLGQPVRFQAAALWRGPQRGEVLLWPWAARPEHKGTEPSRVEAFVTRERLGSVRPLALDAAGRLYVALELLAPGPQVLVTQEIVRIAPDGRRWRQRWPAPSYAPQLQDIEVAPDGGVWRLFHTPGVVHVERAPEADWREVAR